MSEYNNSYILTQALTSHHSSISFFKFSFDGHLLASSSTNKILLAYSLSDISNSSDSRFLVSASNNKTVHLWHIETGTCRKTLNGHTNYVFCINFNPQWNMIVSGAYDKTVMVWDIKNEKCLKFLPAHSDPVAAVDFNCDGSMIVSSSYDGLRRIWDAGTGHYD